MQGNGKRGLRGSVCSKAFLPARVCSFAFSKAFRNQVTGKQETQAQGFHRLTDPGGLDKIESE